MVSLKKYISLAMLVLSSCSYLQMGDEEPQAGIIKQDDTIWPIKDAPQLLASGQTDNAVPARDNEGKDVQFVVAEEYLSAANQTCKKYYVDMSLHLACYGDNWYPVRVF